MKRGPRPIAHSQYMGVFQWVVVNIVDAAFQITLVATRMLPKTGLPQHSLAPSVTARGYVDDSLQVRLSKVFLDLLPTYRVVGVACRQRPHRMEVIGKQDNSLD